MNIKNKRQSLTNLILSAIIVIMAVLLVVSLRNGNYIPNDPNITGIIGGDKSEDISDDEIVIQGFQSITVKAGQTRIDTYLVNSPKNNVGLLATVKLEDGTVLYESGVIPPGSAIYSIPIPNPLEKGEHNATVEYTGYANGERLNTTVLNVVIIAE